MRASHLNQKYKELRPRCKTDTTAMLGSLAHLAKHIRTSIILRSSARQKQPISVAMREGLDVWRKFCRMRNFTTSVDWMFNKHVCKVITNVEKGRTI